MPMNSTDHPHYDAIVQIAAAIQTAEKDADAGIISTAELIITTIKLQGETGFAPSSAEPALAKLRLAMDAGLAGRTAIVEAHLEYGRLAASLGATPSSWGPTWPCTPSGRATRPRRRLAAVA